ncbi:MAG: cytochrome c oxidase subunit 2 [Phycisphaerales bacterium]|jgi:cytochrome c oxidase subunit 2
MNEFMQRMFFGGPSQTEVATHTDGLFIMLWWYGVFWFVLLMGLMVFWVIKYRRRPGVPAPVSPSHNTTLEVFWTVVPSSTLLIIFLLGFWGYMQKVVPTGDAMQLNVTAMKWAWSLEYPNGVQSTWVKTLSEVTDPITGDVIAGEKYPIFVVPEDTDFNLRMISTDVIHAFWIPDLRTKMDVYPNRYTGFAFKTPTLDQDVMVDGKPRDTVTNPETGEDMVGRDLVVFCAEYCGDKHSQMAAVFRVVPQGDYDKWLADQGVELPPIETGRAIWQTKCAPCHTTNGTPNVGPTWSQASYGDQQYGWGYDVKLNNGEIIARDDNYYRESILDPLAKVVGGYPGNMPSFNGQLSETQIAGIIAYIHTLSDRGPVAEEAPVEVEPADPATDPAPNQTTPADPASTQADS